jgi:hypothetical protein
MASTSPTSGVMFKIKHERTADCVVAGYRVHKSGPDAIGSLLLGLVHGQRRAGIGKVSSARSRRARRKELFREMQPLVKRSTTIPGTGPRWKRAVVRHEQRDVPVERGKDLLVRFRSPGAGGRSALRPHGRATVPAHRAIRPLATGSGAVVHARTSSWSSRSLSGSTTSCRGWERRTAGRTPSPRTSVLRREAPVRLRL